LCNKLQEYKVHVCTIDDINDILTTLNQPLTTYWIDILAHTLGLISLQKTNHRRHILGHPVKIIAAQRII
jgi:hypothetical protein